MARIEPKVEVKNGFLTLTISLKDAIPLASPSASGKTMLVTHAGGVLPGIEGPGGAAVKYGFNVYHNK